MFEPTYDRLLSYPLEVYINPFFIFQVTISKVDFFLGSATSDVFSFPVDSTMTDLIVQVARIGSSGIVTQVNITDSGGKFSSL